MTLHTNEGSYLAHTQGKKHQTNLARRAARDAKETQLMIAPTTANEVPRKVFLKIGRPGYRVTKIRDKEEGMEGMMVQIHLPQIKTGVIPRKRFMSAYEQKREPPNKAYQYLIVSFDLSSSQLLLHTHNTVSRLQQSHTKVWPSGYRQKSLKRRTSMSLAGTGLTGIPIRNSSAFNSCFDQRVPSDEVCILQMRCRVLYIHMATTINYGERISCAELKGMG